MPTVNHREIQLSPEEVKGLVCTPDEFLAMNAHHRRLTLLTQITEARQGTAPFKHDQGWWAKTEVADHNECGWSFCAAGWTLLLAGEEERFEMLTILYDGRECLSSQCGAVPDRAQELLGLSAADGSYIFSSVTRFDQIKEALLEAEVVEYDQWGDVVR